MNKILLVSTSPYLVLIVQPSMSGSRSRCTPSLLASPLRHAVSRGWHTLSISSMNTIPSCAAERSASLTIISSLATFSTSACSRYVRASCTRIFCFCVDAAAAWPGITTRITLSRPVAPASLNSIGFGLTSTSTTCVSSSPLRSSSRMVGSSRAEPSSRRSRRCSTRCCTCLRWRLATRCLVWLMATVTRSLMIVSTSRPWKPTSVNLVASTLRNGASTSVAMRRAISVLPTPVGPIMRMFFGIISSLRSPSMRCRRHRLRSAMATARFACDWPTMCWLSRSTVAGGVSAVRSAATTES
mmetsp:Transcript_32207/g.78859  ORF Transcript_32207/g.78859 Transcript_32207/m.78859 type:complete len:299 (+) Transcript_32207:502-1398(+)